MPQYLDNASATEIEFVLWGLSVIGMFLTIAGVTLFARYVWRKLTALGEEIAPEGPGPLVSDARWRERHK